MQLHSSAKVLDVAVLVQRAQAALEARHGRHFSQLHTSDTSDTPTTPAARHPKRHQNMLLGRTFILSWKVVPRLCNDLSGMAKRCKERNTPQTAFDAFVVRAVSGLLTSARSQAWTFQTSNFSPSLVLSQKPIDSFVLFLHVSFVSHAWSKLFGFWSISRIPSIHRSICVGFLFRGYARSHRSQISHEYKK